MANRKPFASAFVDVNDLNDVAYVYDRSATAVAVANTTETTIYSVSVGASALGSNWALAALIRGTLRDESAQTFTLRVKFGGTTMYVGSTTFALAATQRWRLELDLANLGAANSQDLNGVFITNLNTTGTTTGTGGLGGASVGEFGGTATEDTTSAKTLAVTVQWGGTPAVGLTKLYADALLL